jgi:hypothetical protein
VLGDHDPEGAARDPCRPPRLLDELGRAGPPTADDVATGFDRTLVEVDVTTVSAARRRR